MNSSPVGTGFTSSPSSPEYMDLNKKENLQMLNNSSKLPSNAPWNPGVLLAQDGLMIPLEQYPIADEKTNTSRPTLMPVYRTRFVTDATIEDTTQGFYLQLRSSLSPELQTKLINDEALAPEDRDPDLVALDNGLKFEANAMAFAKGLSIPSDTTGPGAIGAQQYLAMPDTVRNQMLNYGTTVSNFLDNYLSTISSNDPSYDILLNASNQIKDGLVLLNPTLTPPVG